MAVITYDEFVTAVTSNGYRRPTEELYRLFAENTANFSRNEVAMFLAHLIRESAGFTLLEEKQGNNKYSHKETVGLPGKSYHGRGYIQITLGANYLAASRHLGMGDRLLQQPEIVAQDKRLAMLVSVWFWTANVKPRLRGKEDQFGVTTRAVNPGECNVARLRPDAEHRYRIYLKVAEVLKIQNKARENGCYN